MVMPRLDSLKKVEIGIDEYAARMQEYQGELARIMADTTLPPKKRREQMATVKSQLEDVQNLGYMEKMATQCSRNGETVDICNYGNGLIVPQQFVKEKAIPVGMLEWNRSFGNYFGPDDYDGGLQGRAIGTGGLVGVDLYLTAAHCFRPEVNSGILPMKNNRDRTSQEMAPLMNVVFNFQKISSHSDVIRDSLSFPVLGIVEIDKAVDYAIVRLGARNGKMPGEIHGYFKTVPTTYVNKKDTVSIIQHMEGGPKRVQCGVLFDCDDSLLYYNNIDTYGGSSGAPVINYATGMVEGVHVDGNCYMQEGSNKAVKIQRIKRISKILKD